MRVSMEQAGDRVEELVERAERGEPVIITRNGQDAAILRPVEPAERRPPLTREERRQILKEIMESAALIPDPYPEETAARSQDFLYDENGLPK